MSTQKHVFISHSHKDSAVANSVVTALEQRGIPCWIAPRDVTPGGSYAESILTAIETASCFVLIYSEHSNVSSHVLREVERALKFGVNIVPVRFDDSAPSKSLDYLLATVHWLAIPAESRDHSIAKAAEQIAQWLTNFLKNPATPLPVRSSTLQTALVTSLERPRRPNRLLIGGMVMAVLVTAGIFAADHVPFFKKVQPSNEVTSTIVPTEVPPELRPTAPAPPAPTTHDIAAPKVKKRIGYAGVDSGAGPRRKPLADPAYNSTANQPSPPNPSNERPNGNYGPPPPPPGGPMGQDRFGNDPGMGGQPAGQFPPPGGPGRPMSGPNNGPGPGQPPPPPGGPRR